MAMTTCPECGKEVSTFATTCPHCGFPIKTEPTEKTTYQLSVGGACDSALSIILRVVAVIIWIGGLIASIALANQTTYHTSSYNYYSYSETKFSFGYFLIYLLAFGFAGWMEWLLANVVEAIYDTRSMIAGLTLLPKVEQFNAANAKSPSGSRPSASSAAAKKANDEYARKKEEKAARLNAYWESHADEKAQLEKSQAEIKQKISSLNKQKTALEKDEQSQILAISQKKDIKELEDKIHTYESTFNYKSKVGGRRKEELLNAIRSVREAHHKLETKYKEEIKENTQAQITKINEQIHQLQARIREIDTELTKDR